MAQLQQLQNIGKTLATRLEEIGVLTEQDLVALGPTEAHRRIQQNYPETRLPVCYYLYSLEGAIRGVNWRDFTDQQKLSMRRQAGLAS